MTTAEYYELNPELLIPTYAGERASQGVLIPFPLYEGEGYASLKCGATEVRLSYSLLHLMCGWIAVGVCGASTAIPMTRIDDLKKAINAICCEASLGNEPAAIECGQDKR